MSDRPKCVVSHNLTAAVVFYGAGSLVEERRAGDLQ